MKTVRVICNRRIKGVINAAMVLNDALLENMTRAKFDAAIAPKLRGTLNLHLALQEASQNPDFFIMLSSASGYLGQTSQSNYAAANTFLDSFARYRRSQGLTGTSLALGVIQGIGFVSENEGVLQSIQRTGIFLTACSERDFLAGIELAMFPPQQDDRSAAISDDNLTESYALMGLEPIEMLNEEGVALRDRLHSDPRSSIWSSALSAALHRNHGSKERGHPADSTLSESSIKSLVLSKNEEARLLLLASIKEHLATFLLLELNELEEERCISDYGLDSMVAAEFRNWTFRAFSVTVGFLELLKPDCTVVELARVVEQRILAANKG